MIGMARFREHNADTSFRINTYYQRDYIAFALIRNFILSTIGYVFLLLIIAMYDLEDLLSNLNSLEIRPLLAAVIIGYLVFLGVFSVIAYIMARIRYVRTQHNVERYEEALERLYAMYREEGYNPFDDPDSDKDNDSEDDER